MTNIDHTIQPVDTSLGTDVELCAVSIACADDAVSDMPIAEFAHATARDPEAAAMARAAHAAFTCGTDSAIQFRSRMSLALQTAMMNL